MISPIEDIIADMRAGRMVVLVDDEHRENEGDLVLGAQFANAEHINFMATFGRGLICLTLTEAHCRKLNLSKMVQKNSAKLGTNFTISIEAAEGISTGISVADRAHTIQVAIAKDAKPDDIVSPGHVFPLAAERGVLVRAGHTEAGCDLATLAGLSPASVICEILKEDGSMARLPDLSQFAQTHQLKIGSIADLIHYRAQTERLVEPVAERRIHTSFGPMQLRAYRDKISQETHLALIKGQPKPEQETLVRVHEPLSLLDMLDLDYRAHSWNVLNAMKVIQQHQTGVIVLLHLQENATSLIERVVSTHNTPPPSQELRNYGIGAQILRDCGVGKMCLLAVPRKMPSMDGFGLQVTRYLEEPPCV